MTGFLFLGSKITVDSDCSLEIKRCLLLGRKAMTNLDSMLKSRDITLPPKVYIVKTMVFPVVIYRCETIKKAESESEVAQSCLTLCDPMDCSPPSSSVHGILQARVLEWVAISFSRRSSRPRDWTQVSRNVGRCFTVWATGEVLFTGVVGKLIFLSLSFFIYKMRITVIPLQHF